MINPKITQITAELSAKYPENHFDIFIEPGTPFYVAKLNDDNSVTVAATEPNPEIAADLQKAQKRLNELLNGGPAFFYNLDKNKPKKVGVHATTNKKSKNN